MWFKRDLRLRDNAALESAIRQTGKTDDRRLLLLYVFEPSLVADQHYDIRHWRFVLESITFLNKQLQDLYPLIKSKINLAVSRDSTNLASDQESGNGMSSDWQVHVFFREVPEVFEAIGRLYQIDQVFSHQETGLRITYDRDIKFANYCLRSGINWHEFSNNGIIRKLKNKKERFGRWTAKMNSPQQHPDFDRFKPVHLDQNWLCKNRGYELPESWNHRDWNFQQGGEDMAHRYMDSFFKDRILNYTQSLSKPLESRQGCSRLSPYLAWGCISTRQVYQTVMLLLQNATSDDKKLVTELDVFLSRLKCQSSFTQQFESNDKIEFTNTNPSAQSVEISTNKEHFQRWASGQTGYPLIDACMRCLIQTGYVNFRMRALLISFLTHHLFQDWKEGAKHLARTFTDFEPGIHYAQMQLQSGMGNFQTVRVYNPVKQSYEHDPEGIFIKQWIPELVNCSERNIHEPWKMSFLQQELSNIIIGKDYPSPVVDVLQSGKEARSKLFNLRKSKVG